MKELSFKMSKKVRKENKKILLVGNGFTSALIPNYRNSTMKRMLRDLYPALVIMVDSIWENIYNITKDVYRDINDINEPREVYDDLRVAIMDEEGIVPHKTHIEVDNFSGIKDSIINCFTTIYEIDLSNATKIFKKFFLHRSSILRFQVVCPEIEAIEPFYALVKLAFRLNVINHDEKNTLVNAIKHILRNNDQFYFDDVQGAESLKEGVRCYLNQFSKIFTTNYDQLLEVCDTEIVHLHGSFLEKDIILGVDEEEKQIKNKYAMRLELLRNIDCVEIHIFGYSGKNDIHINTAIRDNGCNIVFYCLNNIKHCDNPFPEDVKKDELHNTKFHNCVKWSFGISEKEKCNFVFRDRDEIWNQIFMYVKK